MHPIPAASLSIEVRGDEASVRLEIEEGASYPAEFMALTTRLVEILATGLSHP